jgi:phosphomethylpyrimidine synthase
MIIGRYRAPNIKVKNKLRNIPILNLGPNYKTGVRVTVGVTKNYSTVETEIKKVKDNMKYGIEIINDTTISSLEDIEKFHRRFIKEIPIVIGTVPTYELYLEMKKRNVKIVSKNFMKDIFLRQAERGIDIWSIHSGFTRKHLDLLKRTKKYIDITARTGSIIYEYMNKTGQENFLFEYFDEILNICSKYNITLSMSHAFRPACIMDEPEETYLEELKNQSRFVQEALKRKVNVMIEIGGHVKLAQLKEYMILMRKTYKGALLSVMGPILTDTSIGHDHITASIGFVLAGIEGADLACYISPDEHIGIPTVNSIRDGLIAHRIASHIIDTYKLDEYKDDIGIAETRKTDRTCFMLTKGKKFLIDPYNPNLNRIKDECSMCGVMCPYKKVDKVKREKKK